VNTPSISKTKVVILANCSKIFMMGWSVFLLNNARKEPVKSKEYFAIDKSGRISYSRCLARLRQGDLWWTVSSPIASSKAINLKMDNLAKTEGILGVHFS